MFFFLIFCVVDKCIIIIINYITNIKGICHHVYAVLSEEAWGSDGHADLSKSLLSFIMVYFLLNLQLTSCSDTSAVRQEPNVFMSYRLLLHYATINPFLMQQILTAELFFYSRFPVLFFLSAWPYEGIFCEQQFVFLMYHILYWKTKQIICGVEWR